MNAAVEHTVECQWPYRQHILACLFMPVLFGCIASLCLHFALTDNGAAVVHGIRIPANIAVPLRWCTAVLMWSLFVGWLIMLWGRLSRPDKRIAITSEGVLMPRNRWKSKEEYLRFDEIQDVSVTSHRGHVTFFNMQSSRGRFSIARQMLTRSQFEEISALIRQRRRAVSE